MMKKLLGVVLLCLSTTMVFSFEETLSDKPMLMDWKFEPEVSTKAGFNFDSNSYGLLGTAKLDLTSYIYEEADREFMGEGDFYGYVNIEDLEVKVFVDDGASNYDSTASGNTSPFIISWGEIEGKIFSGPVYFGLKTVSHDEVDFIETLDDEDLDFSTIGYSIIPAFYTGSYRGLSGNLSTSDADVTTSSYVDNAFSEDNTNLSAASVGLLLPEILDIEIGASMAYSYKQRIPTDYNPYAISLKTDVYALNKLVENLSLKAKFSIQGGYENNQALQEDNPLTGGLILGYAMPLFGNMTLTPKLAGEVQAEYKDDYVDSSVTEFNTLPGSSWYIPFEIATGASLDWRQLGYSSDDSEDDHISFSNRDVKVQDGVSLAFLYGQAPHENYRNLNMRYIGTKISVWESEDTDKPGLIPNLKSALIFNANYVLGGSVDLESAYSSAESGREYTYDPRLDIGVGAEASYKVSFLEPYAGILYKFFNATDSDVKLKVTNVSGTVTETTYSSDEYQNRSDLRAKLGIDITEIVNYVTFNVEWQSGDLLNDEADGYTNYTDYNYFENNVSATNNSINNTNTEARLGFISAGVKITY